jgi:hypothetical protein
VECKGETLGELNWPDVTFSVITKIQHCREKLSLIIVIALGLWKIRYRFLKLSLWALRKRYCFYSYCSENMAKGDNV